MKIVFNIFKAFFKLFNIKIAREQDFERIVLQKLLKSCSNLLIFDVGAYTGEKAFYYLKIFPNSNIICFEPFPKSYDYLSRNLRKIKTCKLENLAISNQTGDITFSIKTGFDQGNSLLDSSTEEFGKIAEDILKESSRILVRAVTLDQYTSDHNISHINLLKLDIQGAELLALKGAEYLLQNKKIDFIYLEGQFLQMYKDQPYFHDICKFLYDRNYRLYNFFGGQSIGYQLREVNALFYRNDLNVE